MKALIDKIKMQKLNEYREFILVKNRIKTIYVLMGILLLTVVYDSCSSPKKNDPKTILENAVRYDLPEILKDGKLTVLAENSSTSFFIYRGRKMGFEYEVLKEFANELGVELEIKIVNNLDELTQLLNDGEGDIIACNYTITKERCKLIDFSLPTMRSEQVLIQRKPSGWEKMKPYQLREKLLIDPSQLAHKKISVWKNSSYYQRLKHLQEEIGDTIFIQQQDGQMGAEELIEMVSEGMIDYTITESNLARINQRFYENIDISLGISVKQKIGYGIRKSSPLLKARLDKWLESFMRKTTFKYIKHKYYDLAQVSSVSQSELSSLKSGQLSHYDAYFKKAASKYGWDWRLLASLSFQETRFNPDAVSFGGAYSIMQFMPEIGPLYGVYPYSPPEVQIMGGAKKLNSDFNSWSDIPDKLQRQKFTMATYNSGRSHIEDAQRLAEKHGLNPKVWDDNVEVMMLNLSKKEYYRDPVVQSGAAKGTVTHKYVREIISRYEMWTTLYH
jgi:membrane-bound lytic murein transglycosylase F